jgi:hypothetical protein
MGLKEIGCVNLDCIHLLGLLSSGGGILWEQYWNLGFKY